MLGLDANVVRNGSASCHVSPLSEAGIMSTTRTPGGGGGGGGGGGEGSPSGGLWGRRQAATTKATAAGRVVARMATGYTGGGGGLGDRKDAEPGQQARGHLCGWLSTPQAAFGQTVEEKDDAEGEAEDEERDVAELMERDEESHVGLRDGRR